MPSRSLQFGTDQSLYEALLRREDKAYEWLYSDLYPSFRFWITTNSGTEADAEDAFQKGLISFLANLESGRYQYQPGTKVTTVIFDYCKKVWLTELGSARRRHAATMPEEIRLATTDDTLDDLVRTDTVEAVRAALSELKEGCRQLMHWFYVDERSLREIALEMNMKETSVKSKRYECTEQLKRIYQKIAVRRGS
ncbi:RNA polymerase sigma factor [uncultured Fibrella sp.]|uniref:RNA polymerase sigma factor n=1 Tax=uncultured Fibrella sp. TaxID=1284596 RepID=UPI0035CBBAB1